MKTELATQADLNAVRRELKWCLALALAIQATVIAVAVRLL